MNHAEKPLANPLEGQHLAVVDWMRSRKSPKVRPCDVSKVEDLPQRLFLGDVIPESFHKEGNSWNVRYVDSAADSGVDLSWNGEELSCEHRQGDISFTRSAPGDHEWSDKLAVSLCSEFPRNWEAEIAERIERDYNLQMDVTTMRTPWIAGFPDGLAFMIMIPLPVVNTHRVMEFRRKVRYEADFRSNGCSWLAVATQQIAYKKSKCPALPKLPVDLYYKAGRDSGLLPLGLPYFFQHYGEKYIGIPRAVPVLMVNCYLRDMFRILECLKESRLLHDAPEDMGDIHLDFRGKVTPHWMYVMTSRAAYRDGFNSRRICLMGLKEMLAWPEDELWTEASDRNLSGGITSLKEVGAKYQKERHRILAEMLTDLPDSSSTDLETPLDNGEHWKHEGVEVISGRGPMGYVEGMRRAKKWKQEQEQKRIESEKRKHEDQSDNGGELCSEE